MTVMIWPSGVFDLAVDADATDWDGVTVDDLSELAGRTRPLRRLLLMLGYQVDHVLVQAHVGDSWARLDLVEMEASALFGSGSGGEVMEGFQGPVLALPIPAYLDPRAAESGPVTMGLPLASRLGYWTVNTETGYLFLIGSPFGSVQNAFLDTLEAIVPAILESAGEAMESTALEPAAGSGLLWLTDPETWFADMEAMRGSPAFAELESMALLAHSAVTDTLGDAGTPELDFLIEQTILRATTLTGRRAPWLYRHLAPTLKQLLRWTPEGERYFSRHADRFFTCLGVWLAERHQEGLLSPAELDALRHEPWFGVLATLVDRGIIDPPALASSVVEEFEDEEPPPVVAERVDSVTVELTVHRSLTIQLKLVRDSTGALVEPTDPPGEDKTLLDPIPEFSWDYLVPTDPAELPMLAVVAAPGVEIDVPRSPAPNGWWVNIIRVQDASLVPAWGTAVDPALALAPHPISPTPLYPGGITLPDDPAAEVASMVVVRPRADGVTLRYPSGTGGSVADLLTVDITLGGDPRPPGPGSRTGALYSAEARFAYDVVYYRDDRSALPDPVPHIVVWVTEGVTVAATTTAMTEPQDLRLHSEVWQVRDYTEIPAFGDRLPFDSTQLEHFVDFAPGWAYPWTEDESSEPRRTFTALPIETMTVLPSWWFTTVVDVIVGMIPVYGDLIDIADFAIALGTNHDKWGNPVSGEQLVLMGVFALMPVASTGLAKGLGRSIPGFTAPAGLAPGRIPEPTRIEAITGVRSLALRMLRPAGASAADAEKLARRAASFDQLTPAERTDVIEDLRSFVDANALEFAQKSSGQVLSPDALLDATGAGIRVPEAMRDYGRWRADKIRANPAVPIDELSIDTFIADVAAPRTRTIFEALLGNRAVGSALAGLRRSASAAERWKSTKSVVLRKSKPPRTFLRDQVRAGALVTAVRQIVASRAGADATHGGMIWVDQLHLARSEFRRISTHTYEVYTARLIEILSGGNPGAITLDALGLLVGRKLSHYTGELAQLLVVAMDVASHELARSKRSLDDILQSPGTQRRIENVVGFFHGIVTSKGNEQGGRFEVFVAGDEISKASNVFIRLSARLPGVVATSLREGPDILRYIGTAARIADIIQCKAYRTLTSLASSRPVSRWMVKGKWKGPAVFEQLITDIQRMAGTVPPFTLESLQGAASRVGFSGHFEFAFDIRHYLTSSVKEVRSPSEIRRLSRLSVTTLLERYGVQELLSIIDDIKGIKTETEIEELLDGLAPQIEDGLQRFLDQPNLGEILGITIPDGMKFTITVTFR